MIPISLKNYLRTMCTLLLILLALPVMAQHQPLLTNNTDIGDIEAAGTMEYNQQDQIYTIRGGGSNMWYDEDAFHMVWRKMTGDFILRSRVAFRDSGAHAHRKMGVIARTGLEAGDAYVDIAVHGDGLTSMQFRTTKGDSTSEIRSTIKAPDVLELKRKDGIFTMSVATFGEPYSSTTLQQVQLAESVYVGLFVCSHSKGTLETAEFSNVRLIKPAPDDFVPYRDYIGSRLEIMDINSGHRTIIHTSPISIQAPNWTPDDESLIFNSEGLLYTFNLETAQVEVLNTDFADENNNDHVLTFDGSRLGISHHAEEHDGESIIYTLPSSGGTPQKVTDQGPSYLHGWSPDEKYLTYTGGRDGKFDIYKIPSDGGQEIKLTDYNGLDDGPEYTPDGRYIYYNSTRTGTMEIWRMKPDGTGHEQITDDQYNNWFPHISPDGSEIVFLSYLSDVDPADHPFYKHVYIRRMTIDGENQRVAAYVYGGQGTINVPSWSPDGRKISFVSNSDLVK